MGSVRIVLLNLQHSMVSLVFATWRSSTSRNWTTTRARKLPSANALVNRKGAIALDREETFGCAVGMLASSIRNPEDLRHHGWNRKAKPQGSALVTWGFRLRTDNEPAKPEARHTSFAKYRDPEGCARMFCLNRGRRCESNLMPSLNCPTDTDSDSDDSHEERGHWTR